MKVRQRATRKIVLGQRPISLGNRPNMVSGSMVSNAELSEFFPLTEFRGEAQWVLSAYYFCAKANSPSSQKVRAVFWEGDATKHFSVKKRCLQWKVGRQFSEEVQAIQRTAGLWKLKSCCPHPKRPFRTKNTTALHCVVFYYRCSFYYP